MSMAIEQLKSESKPMETETMGRVTVEATFENNGDLWNVVQGSITADQVRRVEVPNALIDTGATMISLPTRLIQELGLVHVSSKRVTSSVGVGTARHFSAVQVTIQGRSCVSDVMEVPDGVPVLIGQVPLEILDFVVDLKGKALIGNPAHGGEHMYELY